MEKIPAGTWIVVADGEGARVFTNIGDDRKLSLRQDDLLSQDDSIDTGPGNVPKDKTDADLGEAAFSRELAQRINDAALKNRFEHLVLIADPHSLGRMRPLLHKETLSRMVGELPKTLTNSPIEDIERALS
jgi:protein required for attachment to host cells